MAFSAPNRYNREIVTSGDDTRNPAPLTRRSARALAAPASASASKAATSARWSRRRGVVGVFAGVAALAFAAASVGPAAFALSEAAPAQSETETVYSSTLDDAQSLVVASGAVVSLDRDSYSAFEKPKPPPPPAPKVAAASPATPFYSGGGAPSEWMAAAGIAESDWGYVDYIVSKESGWNPNATNSGSGACGLVQALPCSKVPGNGYDPVDNLRWANGYAVGRYGSWAGAYNFWINNNWW